MEVIRVVGFNFAVSRLFNLLQTRRRSQSKKLQVVDNVRGIGCGVFTLPMPEVRIAAREVLLPSLRSAVPGSAVVPFPFRKLLV